MAVTLINHGNGTLSVGYTERPSWKTRHERERRFLSQMAQHGDLVAGLQLHRDLFPGASDWLREKCVFKLLGRDIKAARKVFERLTAPAEEEYATSLLVFVGRTPVQGVA